MSKFLKHSVRQYIFIILSATILLCTLFSNSFANENIFIVEEVKTKGLIDKNFKRENHINKALSLSFEMLMSKVLVSSDLTKIKNVKIKEIKNLINSIQVLDEKYNKNQYESSFKIFYNEEKIKQLLINKSISFSQPKKISVVLLPTLFVDGKIKSFQENYFYNEWNKNKEKNKLIKFILPIDDLDDFLKIEKLKDTIEDLNMQEIAHKYDEKNYIFLVMNYKKSLMSIYIKTFLDGEKVSKNISYQINNFEDKKKLDYILNDLKIKLEDIWKEINFINLLMPLSIDIQFKHLNNTNLDNLKNNLNKISIIDNYIFEKFDINYSYYKVFYYGTPKKLKSELNKYGYDLKDKQGKWEIVSYE